MTSTTLTRRLLAGATVLGLSFATVACAEDNGEANGNADNGAETAAEDTADSTAEETEGAEAAGQDPETEETVDVETADGNTALVPQAFADAIAEREQDWGQPQTIQEGHNGSIAKFENGDRIVYSEDTGAVELVGMIGAAWDEQGGMDGEVGLPVAAEQETDNGWTQEFQNGVISWERDAEGNFDSTIEPAQ